MHHYPFHVGDYTLATLHLEDRHDLCYRRLLDAYYLDEQPLADAKQTLSRRIRTDEQTLAEVLEEFFFLEGGKWHHKRCDTEISRYQAKSEKAKLAGSQGGKAKASKRQANAKQTLSERLANQNQNQNHSTTSKDVVGRTASHSPQQPDDAWLSSLETDKTYTGISIRTEFGKMQRWCEANRKQPSRKRFVNWLNRVEKPMHVNGSGVDTDVTPRLSTPGFWEDEQS